MRVEYDSNNSGGDWWLSDDDWKALEAAGWTVAWREERWLGALATSATRDGLSLADAIEEWERATGANSNDLGCACCGAPHSFSFTGDDGENEWYAPNFPSQGARYS